MATQIWGAGPIKMSGEVDSEGHRSYRVTFLIKSGVTDGPAAVLQTPGLPLPGSIWTFGADVDVFAWRRAEARVTPRVDKEACEWWEIEFTYSTKPPDASRSRCQDTRVEDPLLEPAKISGSFVKSREEATHDRFGQPIVNSAWEQIRGPQVEFDVSRPQVKIEFNSATLNESLIASMIDCVNDTTLWGLPARTIKFSDFGWERLFYAACYKYFKLLFTFDINYRYVYSAFGTVALGSGWDRDLLDEGTKVLKGHWSQSTGNWTLDPVGPPPLYNVQPDPNNPAHFIRFKDRNGEASRVILNGHGVPYDPESTGTSDDVVGTIRLEKYPSANLLLLGIPAILG